MAKNPKKIRSVKKEIKKKHFRVTMFGSARIKEDDKIYKQVYELAKEIAKNDFDLITGGGPGLMKAANSGHQKGKKSDDVHSIGIMIRLPFEVRPNKYLDIKQQYDRFSDRLDEFMILSDVIVVLPGGIGTCLELFYTWQLTQVKHICSMPIILVGDMWTKLLRWVKEEILDNNRMSPEDMQNMYCVKNKKEAMEIIIKAHEVFEKEGENYCFNYKKYKID